MKKRTAEKGGDLKKFVMELYLADVKKLEIWLVILWQIRMVAFLWQIWLVVFKFVALFLPNFEGPRHEINDKQRDLYMVK